jgi:ribonuclease Z
VSTRELVILGTASQAPTRERNHNGYLLRWGPHGILFDPGEGTQRQFEIAGLSTSVIDRICITHFHGDHCLGLPGVLLRLSMDHIGHRILLNYPAGGEEYLQRLRNASAGHDSIDLHPEPIHAAGVVASTDDYVLSSAALDHVVPTVGWRIEDPPARRIIPERLAQFGIAGPAITRLRRDGRLELADGRVVGLSEVSEERSPTSMAFVMDTRWCDGAVELADGVDLLVCEATFTDDDADLALEAGHLTGRQAGRLAAQAGAQRLVLSHFSSRYADQDQILAEARAEFDETVIANDFDRFEIRVSPDRSS